MGISKVLWLDLRFFRDQTSSYHYLSRDWIVSCIHCTDNLHNRIRKNAPAFLCFEYDYPDTSGLLALQKTSFQFPSLPIIMLTDQHSEALVVWALRNHVWDYFSAPFKPGELIASAAAIREQQLSAKPDKATLQRLYNPLPTEVKFRPVVKKRTCLAQSFVKTHYHDRIKEKQVAQLCGMNCSTFSRCFKKEQGMTFTEYLAQYRINKATKLLQNSNALVSDIAYTVGFQDPSYFARAFRRMTGKSPTHCRKYRNSQ
jgi:AraC-like DNA-binding protein